MATEKSKEILQYREQGLGYKRIAALTGYSLNTVKSVCRRNPNGEEKLCLQCGAKLVRTPHYREKKFCSDACRVHWWNTHQDSVGKKAFYDFTCAYCGKPFRAYGNSHRKYCCHACCIQARFQGGDGHD